MPEGLLHFYHAAKIRISKLLKVILMLFQLLKPAFAFGTSASAAEAQSAQ